LIKIMSLLSTTNPLSQAYSLQPKTCANTLG